MASLLLKCAEPDLLDCTVGKTYSPVSLLPARCVIYYLQKECIQEESTALYITLMVSSSGKRFACMQESIVGVDIDRTLLC